MKIGLQMRQTQRLVMTPKLQQALKLLQVPTLELPQILKQEILQNPLLEEVDEVEEDEEELGVEAERQEQEEADAAASQAVPLKQSLKPRIVPQRVPQGINAQ